MKSSEFLKEADMSRAAKGHEKYGKEGMNALAKAGREGAGEKKLDAIRDKHDKYNESVTETEKQKGVDGKACWKGYKRMGTKQKGGKTVDNCVKMEGIDPADQGEYDREGEMAIRNLNTAEDAADELRSILDADENLPEWVQKKITLAVDYLDTARDYMKSKESESDMVEETYHGDEFYEAYGEMYYNEDEQLDEAEYQGRKVSLGKPMQGDVKKFKVYVKDPKTGNVKKVNFGDPNMRIKKSNPARRKSFRARHNCANPGPRTKARYWSCRAW
jgi:hypothetical protein